MTTDEGDSSSRRDRGRSFATSAVAVLIGLAVIGGGLWLNRSQELVIVVVSLDTTRFDHLSAYGYERDTTPNLARLAAEGTLFRNARSTSSWTLPSHMSLFTGLPPQLHNVTIDFQTLDAGRATLGEVFSDAGFHTEGVYTAPYLHQCYGFDRGMDFYEAATPNPMVFDLPRAKVNEQMHQREAQSHQEVTSPLAVEQARRFFERRRNPKRLLFLHLFDPHYDYRAGPRYRKPFVDPEYAGEITGDMLMAQLDLIERGDPADLRQLEALYDAELRFTDDYLGALMRMIENSPQADRTLLVVVADHGEEFLENGKYGHRMGLRDEVLRIPMIFWGPGMVPAGQVVEDDVALYDVLPTLMDYADIPARDEIYGRSLKPLIDGGSLPPRPCVSALTFLYADGRDYLTRHESLVLNGLKYVRRMNAPWSPGDDRNISEPGDATTLEVEIFDLAADPGEHHNLLVEAPDDPRIQFIAETFAAEVERMLQQAAGMVSMGAADAMPGVGHTEMLISLGYIGQVGGSSLAGILPSTPPDSATTEQADVVSPPTDPAAGPSGLPPAEGR